jgi:inosine-uridine nucleoside N-ribohydrolase
MRSVAGGTPWASSIVVTRTRLVNTDVCLPAADAVRRGNKSVDATSYVGAIMPSMLTLRMLALASAVLLLPAAMLAAQPARRIPVIVDSDANNELDDQHALAYVLLNGDTFDVKGVTVNATRGGGDVREHYEEARRVMALCGVSGIPLHAGANGSFDAIRPTMRQPDFDGRAAVEFIIARAEAQPAGTPLVLLPIGKLTNIALALARAPGIAKKIRIVWLGSNYPAPGEYNQDNDPEALRYVLSIDVPFEMVLVRYGTPSGTDAIRVTPDEVRTKFAGRGPHATAPVMGRHGEAFSTFGDYSVNLFAHIRFDRTPPSRALYDVGAVAIVKQPAWAKSRQQGAPALVGKTWEDRADNPRKIVIWENFDRDAIVADFVRTLEKPVIAKP